MTMVQKCFVCTGEIRTRSSSVDNSVLLCQILEITPRNPEKKFNGISYCPGCLSRLLSIRDMLEELERLEKKVLDEKYLIEVQLKENAQNYGNNLNIDSAIPSDQLRIEIAAELRSTTIESMLEKIRQKQVGKKRNRRKRPRIMQNVAIPRIETNPMSVDSDPISNESQFNPHSKNQSNFECPETEGLYHTNSTSWTCENNDELDVKYEMESTDTPDDPLASPENFCKAEFMETRDNSSGNGNIIIIPTEPQNLSDLFGDIFHNNIQGQVNPRTFVCGTCGVSFARYNQLKIHDRIHAKTFGSDTTCTRWKKRKHPVGRRRKSLALEPKKCEECGKVLSTLQTWKNHVMSVHRGQNKFTCAICNYGCQVSARLDLHMKTHSKEKEFKCQSCSKLFKYKHNLKFHLENICQVGSKRK